MQMIIFFLLPSLPPILVHIFNDHYNIARAIIIGHVTWGTPPLMSYGRIEAAEDTGVLEAAVRIPS